jgi:hypothetical protein
MTSNGISSHWIRYFTNHFGHYAFATMPLHNAGLSTGKWTISAFNRQLELGYPDRPNNSLSDIIETLTFDDSDYFTLNEYCFLSNLIWNTPVSPISRSSRRRTKITSPYGRVDHPCRAEKRKSFSRRLNSTNSVSSKSSRNGFRRRRTYCETYGPRIFVRSRITEMKGYNSDLLLDFDDDSDFGDDEDFNDDLDYDDDVEFDAQYESDLENGRYGYDSDWE